MKGFFFISKGLFNSRKVNLINNANVLLAKFKKEYIKS
jgi:hypothetical protein